MGTCLVVVPYDSLKFTGNKVTLLGGTKEGLKRCYQNSNTLRGDPRGATEIAVRGQNRWTEEDDEG